MGWLTAANRAPSHYPAPMSDHEAEHLIADLEFGEDDTPEEVQ